MIIHRVTMIIVALPIAIVTSWFLFQRGMFFNFYYCLCECVCVKRTRFWGEGVKKKKKEDWYVDVGLVFGVNEWIQFLGDRRGRGLFVHHRCYLGWVRREGGRKGMDWRNRPLHINVGPLPPLHPPAGREGGYWTKKAISCPTDKYGGCISYMRHMIGGKMGRTCQGALAEKGLSIDKEGKRGWRSSGRAVVQAQASTNPHQDGMGYIRLFEEISCCTKSLAGENIHISLYSLLAPR